MTRRLASCSLLAGLSVAALGLLAGLPARGAAQVIARVGGTASIELPVQMTVPVRVLVTPAGPERVVRSTSAYTDVDLPVRVAANIAWRLTVAVPGDTEASVLVLAESGEWTELGSRPIPLRTGGEPTEPTQVMIRFRVPAGAGSVESLRLRLSVTPLAGAD